MPKTTSNGERWHTGPGWQCACGRLVPWDDALHECSFRWRVTTASGREYFVYAPDEATAQDRVAGGVLLTPTLRLRMRVELAPLEDEVVTMQDGRTAPGA